MAILSPLRSDRSYINFLRTCVLDDDRLLLHAEREPEERLVVGVRVRAGVTPGTVSPASCATTKNAGHFRSKPVRGLNNG